jgi:hypothetical protein
MSSFRKVTMAVHFSKRMILLYSGDDPGGYGEIFPQKFCPMPEPIKFFHAS